VTSAKCLQIGVREEIGAESLQLRQFSPQSHDSTSVFEAVGSTALRHPSHRLVPGTKAVSATIRGSDGRPIAAIRSRLGPRGESEIGEMLKNTARLIETVMNRQA
jgi:DNA-binding IclR family transcriptional regulator